MYNIDCMSHMYDILCLYILYYPPPGGGGSYINNLIIGVVSILFLCTTICSIQWVRDQEGSFLPRHVWGFQKFLGLFYKLLLRFRILHVFIYIYITYNASVFPHCPVSFTRVAYCFLQPLSFPHASTARLAYDAEAFFRSSPYSLMAASVDQPDTMHAKQVIVFLLPIG